MAKLNEYVLAAEAARILGVSVNTVRNWAESGRLTVRRNPANNYRMFRSEDLEKFLREAAKPVVVPDNRKKMQRLSRRSAKSEGSTK